MNLFELSATVYGGQSLRRRRRASDDRPVTGFPTGNHPVLPSPSFFFFSLNIYVADPTTVEAWACFQVLIVVEELRF